MKAHCGFLSGNLFCGPIADAGKPAKGGYQARNLRTIEALRSREIEVRALPYAQPTSSRIKTDQYATGFSVLAWKMLGCKKKSIVHITGLRRVFLYPELFWHLLQNIGNAA